MPGFLFQMEVLFMTRPIRLRISEHWINVLGRATVGDLFLAWRVLVGTEIESLDVACIHLDPCLLALFWCYG